MQRRALGILLFCLVLLVAIIAGYWDMLESEKLRIAERDGDRPAAREGAIEPTGFSSGSKPAETASGAQGESRDGRPAEAGDETAREVSAADDEAKDDASREPDRAAASPSRAAPERSQENAEATEAASSEAGRPGGGEGAPSDAVAATDSAGADRLAAGKSDRRSGSEGTPSDDHSQGATSEASGADRPATAEAGSQPPSDRSAPPAEASTAAGSEAAPEPVAGEVAEPGQPGAVNDGGRTAGNGGAEAANGAAEAGGSSEPAGAPATQTSDTQAVAALDRPVETPDAAAPQSAKGTPSAPDAPQKATEAASSETGRDRDEAASADGAGPGSPSDAAGAGAAQAAAADAPTFDVLRVEPDGSTLVAGRSTPNSKVTLRDGDETIGSDEAGRDGDFVIVLDRPLAPGDHAIQIESEDEGGATRTSRETAVVSVPQDGRSEDLLAMIEEPGAPSRLIDTPAARAPAIADAGRDKDASPNGAETAADGSTADASNGELAGETAPGTDVGAVAEENGSAEEGAPAKSLEDAGSGETDVAAAPASQDTAPQRSAAGSGGTAGDPAVDNSTEERQASIAAPAPAPAETTSPSAARAPLRVEAVEIDDGKIFIAGSAEPGTRFRVYVDNEAFAAGTADRDGRFVVSSDQQLSVGDHLIRVDQLSGPSEVAARVEVPFFRPEGASLAAVAETGGTSDRKPKGVSAAPQAPESEVPAAEVGQAAPEREASPPAAPVKRAEAVPDRREEPAAASNPPAEAAEAQIAERPAEAGEGSADDASDRAALDGNPATGLVSPPAGDGRSDGDTQLAARMSGDADAPGSSTAPADAPAQADGSSLDRIPAAVGNGDEEDAETASSEASAPANANAGSVTAADVAPPLDPLETLASGAAEGVTEGLAEADGETTRGGRVVASREEGGGREEAGSAGLPGTGEREPTDAGLNAEGGDAAASSSGGEATAEADASEPGADVAGAVMPTAEADRPGDVAAAGKSGRVPVLRQPALAASKSSRVIIRKGDTLWRISRETYGAGRRYTVIYLANGDQIRNPDLIYPGQVFRMPEEQRSEAGDGQAAPSRVE
ncbi:LysM peptidoglycan-binding domain-containing protein [Jiella avicenniae]|uniref:LysM peptidoglycan-binding domain-containing protein n=1 Tax=Jiella avicenniae TaxID=2907202 RepID=A0A9X1T3W0_9HYPH|nr:LysM peptidoglycan-binding domain-containing protein [Jiella avicenniae]MCE7026680.1 LysM peptidoglycan-binding domain-containing protein [Jiella avicenniae]